MFRSNLNTILPLANMDIGMVLIHSALLTMALVEEVKVLEPVDLLILKLLEYQIMQA
jgi:hypothetical protein